MTEPDVEVTTRALQAAATEIRGTARDVVAHPPVSYSSSEPSAVAATTVEAALGRFCTGFDGRLTHQAGALDLAAAGFSHMEHLHAGVLRRVADYDR